MGNPLPSAITTNYWSAWMDGMLEDWVIDEVYTQQYPEWKSVKVNYHALREELGAEFVLRRLSSQRTIEEWCGYIIEGGCDSGVRIDYFDVEKEARELEMLLGF